MHRPYSHGQYYSIPFPDSLKTRYGITLTDGKTLDEPLFMNSNEYRDHIFYQVRMGSNPFNSYNFIGSPDMLPLNYTMLDCYKGAAYLDVIPTIRDWYLAKAIMEGFTVYPFNNVEQAYFKFLPEIKTKVYKDSLLSFYAGVQALKPGNPAPVFTLQDSNGKSVSLSDFKGKAIYLDFWGVGCGPCVYDIKNYSAKLHEKYKNKKVVFLNICVDANKAEWKKSLLDLNIGGINLIAEGWVKNPVCKTYHISSIPKYILIDAKGNIVDNNAGRMGELLGLTGMANAETNAAGNNEIDKTLNK